MRLIVKSRSPEVLLIASVRFSLSLSSRPRAKLAAESDAHDGRRKNEMLWAVFQIHHKRSRFVYDMFYRKKRISRELYDFCLQEKYADAALIAKWKKARSRSHCFVSLSNLAVCVCLWLCFSCSFHTLLRAPCARRRLVCFAGRMRILFAPVASCWTLVFSRTCPSAAEFVGNHRHSIATSSAHLGAPALMGISPCLAWCVLDRPIIKVPVALVRRLAVRPPSIEQRSCADAT